MFWVDKMGVFVVYILEIVLSFGEFGLMQIREFSWFLLCLCVEFVVGFEQRYFY